MRKVYVPGSCQGNPRRIRSRQAVVVNAHRPVGHSESRYTQAGNGASIEIIDASNDFDLLVNRHLAEDRIDATLYIGRRGRSLRLRQLRKQKNCESYNRLLGHSKWHTNAWHSRRRINRCRS
jgi:hypothetical protein